MDVFSQAQPYFARPSKEGRYITTPAANLVAMPWQNTLGDGINFAASPIQKNASQSSFRTTPSAKDVSEMA
jgi:hypothetical protein